MRKLFSASQIEMAIRAFTDLKVFLITRSSHSALGKINHRSHLSISNIFSNKTTSSGFLTFCTTAAVTSSARQLPRVPGDKVTRCVGILIHLNFFSEYKMNYCNHQPKREVSASQIEMAIKAFTELKVFLITRSSHFLVRKNVSLYPDFTRLCRTVARWAKGW